MGQFPFHLGRTGRGAAYLVGTTRQTHWAGRAFAATATYLMVVGFENAAADLERRRS